MSAIPSHPALGRADINSFFAGHLGQGHAFVKKRGAARGSVREHVPPIASRADRLTSTLDVLVIPEIITRRIAFRSSLCTPVPRVFQRGQMGYFAPSLVPSRALSLSYSSARALCKASCARGTHSHSQTSRGSNPLYTFTGNSHGCQQGASVRTRNPLAGLELQIACTRNIKSYGRDVAVTAFLPL
jgi:hypothetical protein